MRRKHRQIMSIGFGGLCYYIGDNLPPLFREYRKELHVNDQDWFEFVQVFGICMLAIATLTYIPVLINGAFPSNKEREEIVPTYKKKQTGSVTKEHLKETVQLLTRKQAAPEEKTPVHVVVLLLLANTTNLDLVYTAIERFVSNKCDEKVIGLVWAFFATYFIFFFGFCVHQLWNDKNEARANTTTQGSMSTQGNTRSCCSRICTTTVLAFLISSFTALFILADSRLPLACSGLAETDFNLDIVRLVLWLVDFIIGCTLFGCWKCRIYKKR